MTDFCHISPTQYLPVFATQRSHHLVLAHLVEQDHIYERFYRDLRPVGGRTVIMDNSAFEMYKTKQPMYPTEKLIDMGQRVQADYIVMSDYPGQPCQKTIEAACATAPQYHQAGFGTFFVPQSRPGDLQDLLNGFEWAANSEHVDYIGVSILSAPIAYNVESGNKLQRFLSRWALMQELDKRNILETIVKNGKKIHFLGMVDGPREIILCADYLKYISTWDSSAAVWLGLNGMEFDNSPTGLINGKFELEVDFAYDKATIDEVKLALNNCAYIDGLLDTYMS